MTVELPTCKTDELAIVLPTVAVPLTNICAVVIPTLAPTLIELTKSTGPVIAAPSDDIVNLPPIVDVVVTFNTFVFVVAAASILALAVITPVDVSVPDVFAFVNDALCHLLVLLPNAMLLPCNGISPNVLVPTTLFIVNLLFESATLPTAIVLTLLDTFDCNAVYELLPITKSLAELAVTLPFNTLSAVTVRSFLTTALYTFASLLFAASRSPDRVKFPPTVAAPTIAAVAAFTSPVISTSFPNVPTPVTPNVVPTVAAPTIAALAAFTSPVISTSAPAVISPEVFAVVNAAAHLLSACPKTFPFADGSTLLTINDCMFAPSELFDPITKLAFNVTSPSTFKSWSTSTNAPVTCTLPLNTESAPTVKSSVVASPRTIFVPVSYTHLTLPTILLV